MCEVHKRTPCTRNRVSLTRPCASGQWRKHKDAEGRRSNRGTDIEIRLLISLSVPELSSIAPAPLCVFVSSMRGSYLLCLNSNTYNVGFDGGHFRYFRASRAACGRTIGRRGLRASNLEGSAGASPAGGCRWRSARDSRQTRAKRSSGVAAGSGNGSPCRTSSPLLHPQCLRTACAQRRSSRREQPLARFSMAAKKDLMNEPKPPYWA